MPERPGDRPPAARPQTDVQRAEAARLRQITHNAPPLPAEKPTVPTKPPWSTGLAGLAGLWLSVRCTCGAHTDMPFRYLAAVHGWKTPLRDIVGRLKCTNCGERPTSVEMLDDPTAAAPGVPELRRTGSLQLL